MATMTRSLVLMNVTRELFDDILDSGFRAKFDAESLRPERYDGPKRKHRKRRHLDARGCLALVLMHINSTMDLSVLGLVFALTESTACNYLECGLHHFHAAVSSMDDARVEWPDKDRMKYLSGLASAREPLIRFAFGTVDGCNLRVLEPTDINLQNAMYNGWLSSTYVSNIIVWLFDGCAGLAILNAPGSWHDSAVSVSGGLYQTLMFKTPTPYALVADSAFPRSGELAPKILRPRKDNEAPPEDLHERVIDMALQRQVISLRQAAEWGMGAFQRTCPRLKKPLSWDPAKRLRLLESCIRFVNLRTRRIGLNQIQTVFEADNDSSSRNALGITLPRGT